MKYQFIGYTVVPQRHRAAPHTYMLHMFVKSYALPSRRLCAQR
jgi:hypothetical protein